MCMHDRDMHVVAHTYYQSRYPFERLRDLKGPYWSTYGINGVVYRVPLLVCKQLQKCFSSFFGFYAAMMFTAQ